MFHLDPKRINLIVYHDQCPDGATAAFCAFSILGDTVKYVPCLYNQTISSFKNAENCVLLFLDFSLKREPFLKLQKLANEVFVLDHHLTAKTQLQGLDGVYIDIDKCGASLAWKFFNPNKPQPMFIEYVEDVDLWRWQKKESYYFSLGFYQLLSKNNFDFKIIRNFFSDEGVSKLISEGKKLYLSLEGRIKKACKQILTVKTKQSGENVSLGFIKCRDKTILNDIAIFALTNMNLDGLILSFQYDNKQNKFSLRRLRNNNKIAMHKIAEQYSGGGHAHAASFLSNEDPNSVFASIIENL